jgi:hypothetical protein
MQYANLLLFTDRQSARTNLYDDWAAMRFRPVQKAAKDLSVSVG